MAGGVRCGEARKIEALLRTQRYFALLHILYAPPSNHNPRRRASTSGDRADGFFTGDCDHSHFFALRWTHKIWFSVIFRAKLKQTAPGLDVVTGQILRDHTIGV